MAKYNPRMLMKPHSVITAWKIICRVVADQRSLMHLLFWRVTIFVTFFFYFAFCFRFVFSGPSRFGCETCFVGGGNERRQWHLRSLLILTSSYLPSQDAPCTQQSSWANREQMIFSKQTNYMPDRSDCAKMTDLPPKSFQKLFSSSQGGVGVS